MGFDEEIISKNIFPLFKHSPGTSFRVNSCDIVEFDLPFNFPTNWRYKKLSISSLQNKHEFPEFLNSMNLLICPWTPLEKYFSLEYGRFWLMIALTDCSYTPIIVIMAHVTIPSTLLRSA